MSIQQGLLSPPLSGRTYKSDQPRMGDIHKVVKAVDVFGAPSTSSSSAYTLNQVISSIATTPSRVPSRNTRMTTQMRSAPFVLLRHQ